MEGASGRPARVQLAPLPRPLLPARAAARSRRGSSSVLDAAAASCFCAPRSFSSPPATSCRRRSLQSCGPRAKGAVPLLLLRLASAPRSFYPATSCQRRSLQELRRPGVPSSSSNRHQPNVLTASCQKLSKLGGALRHALSGHLLPAQEPPELRRPGVPEPAPTERSDFRSGFRSCQNVVIVREEEPWQAGEEGW